MPNEPRKTRRGKPFGTSKNITIIVLISAIAIVVTAILLSSSFSIGNKFDKVSGADLNNSASSSDKGAPNSTVATKNYGPYNSAHVHAAFVIKIKGQQIDFSQDKYQLRSELIHVENNDGTTLHRHATGVPFGEFLRSVGMGIEGSCFLLDNGTKYCGETDTKLEFFVNSGQVSSIADYVFNDKDRILVIYGNQTDSQIKNELDALNKITIITVDRTT